MYSHEHKETSMSVIYEETIIKSYLIFVVMKIQPYLNGRTGWAHNSSEMSHTQVDFWIMICRITFDWKFSDTSTDQV